MASPFPGMDPFLEAPGHFPGLHNSFIAYLREALQPLLPEPYYAEIQDRVWLEMGRRMPAVAVPLLPGDGAVVVDLQAVFTRAYDTGPYRRRVRYAGPVPAPGLKPEQDGWLRARLGAHLSARHPLRSEA